MRPTALLLLLLTACGGPHFEASGAAPAPTLREDAPDAPVDEGPDSTPGSHEAGEEDSSSDAGTGDAALDAQTTCPVTCPGACVTAHVPVPFCDPCAGLAPTGLASFCGAQVFGSSEGQFEHFSAADDNVLINCVNGVAQPDYTYGCDAGCNSVLGPFNPQPSCNQ